MSPTSHPSSPVRWWAAPGFAHSLPLFILSAAFFGAGGIVRIVLPTYGPGAFTLWALLFVLGFIAAIGGVVSWTLATEPELPTRPPVPHEPRRAERRTYLPIEFSAAARPPGGTGSSGPGRSRAEFGRPAPETRSAPSKRDWYEDPTDSEQLPGPEYAPPIAIRAASPAPPDAVEPLEPVGSVLAAIQAIERDLAPRKRSVESSMT